MNKVFFLTIALLFSSITLIQRELNPVSPGIIVIVDQFCDIAQSPSEMVKVVQEEIVDYCQEQKITWDFILEMLGKISLLAMRRRIFKGGTSLELLVNSSNKVNNLYLLFEPKLIPTIELATIFTEIICMNIAITLSPVFIYEYVSLSKEVSAKLS